MRLLKATMVLLQLQLNIPLREIHIYIGLHGITIGSTVSVVLFTPSMNMSPGKTTMKSLTSIRKQRIRSWLKAAGALRLLGSRGMQERKEDASGWLWIKRGDLWCSKLLGCMLGPLHPGLMIIIHI